jgi:hypothetical protein
VLLKFIELEHTCITTKSISTGRAGRSASDQNMQCSSILQVAGSPTEESKQATRKAYSDLTGECAASGQAYSNLEKVKSELTVCDKERLHEIGTIQDIGYVVAVRSNAKAGAGLTIVALSENLSAAPWVFEENVSSLIGKDLTSLLDNSAALVCDQVSMGLFKNQKISTCMHASSR